jgi:hypothetical protein
MWLKLFPALLSATAAALLYHYRSPGGISQAESTSYLAIIVCATLYGIWWLVVSKKNPDHSTSKMPRGVKVSLASFILGLSLMLLVALALLPLLGPPSLLLVVGPWSPLVLIVTAVVLIPFVGKKLH